jgi:hypothetical protein
MLSTVPRDIETIAEAILTLFDVVSLLFMSIVYYLIFVGNAISLKRWRRTKRVSAILIANPVLAIVLIVPAHAFAAQQDVLSSLLFLVLGVILYGGFYFWLFKPLIRSADFRIQNTVMMWGAMSALTISALLFLFLSRDFIKMESKAEISYDLLIHSASILISALGIAFTYVMRSEQTNRNSKQQLYQTLELQSIELFRFECEHPDLVQRLWFEEKQDFGSLPTDLALKYCIRQYACQMLNLFEMATRFRTLRVLPEDVFGSWVIWIWELCNCKQFQDFWLDDDDLPSNYVRDFREIITTGVEIANRDETEQKKRSDFFADVAERLNCWEIEHWFARRTDIDLARTLRARPMQASRVIPDNVV